MLKTCVGSFRLFYTHCVYNATPGKVMKKVMGQTSKRKRTFTELGILPSAEMFSKGTVEGRYSRNARRASVLNKLFMKYITDLLATGEYSLEFVGHGIEITRVQISPDYATLNVFWVMKDPTQCETVENSLKKNAGFLRHELSSLRVIGVVPTIHFVKDRHHFQVMELESRLSKADFGEDYTPAKMETTLKTQLELFTPLSPEIKDQLQQLDDESIDNEITEDALPPMPQDVLGLNHSEILIRIKRSMKKSAALHRLDDTTNLEQSYIENPVTYASNKERKEAFKEFLEKRELLKSKMRKMEKNYFPDMEYLREEFKRREDTYLDGLENHMGEDEDLIVENDIDETQDLKTSR